MRWGVIVLEIVLLIILTAGCLFFPSGDAGGSSTPTTFMATTIATPSPSPANQHPTACFWYELPDGRHPPYDKIYSGQTITFNASCSRDPSGEISSYIWDFGDSQSGTGIAPEHIYYTTGNFIVKLTVTDTSGETGGTGRPLIVSPLQICC